MSTVMGLCMLVCLVPGVPPMGLSLILGGFAAILTGLSPAPWGIGVCGPLLLCGSGSLVLCAMTLAISSAALLATSRQAQSMWTIAVAALTLILLAAFQSHSYLVFYAAFESSLWPMLFIVLGWGYQPERLNASKWMAVYTVCASLPLLLGALGTSFAAPSCQHGSLVSSDASGVLLIMIMLGLLVKLPMFLLHLWLPLAHVEAPVGGSMLLAAALLKLGGYGMVVLAPLMPTLQATTTMLQSAGLAGGMLAGGLCILQSDMKTLIAYSSVAHMSFIVISLLSQTALGLDAALLIMVAHGFSSSLMFAGAYVLYLRTHSRNMALKKGEGVLVPSFMLVWFLACCLNMGAPPSLNFMAEALGAAVCMGESWLTSVPVAVMVFSAGVYSLLVFICPLQGTSASHSLFLSLTPRELLWLYAHIVVSFIFLLILM